ncbi:MAG TPA: hypothetical protein VGK38_01550 [Prolixibacteraceae bacterium]|jgi:hypothetical protein
MPKANDEPIDRYYGIKKLIENIGLYYDKILSGELDWVEMLEEHMTQDAVNTVFGTSEDKNEKL